MLEILKNNSLWFLLAIGTGYTFFWLERNKSKLKIKTWVAVLLAVLHTVMGVMCVKVFAVMETLDFSKAGSMSLFGGIFFLPLFYWTGAKLFKRKTSIVFDVFTTCMIFTLLCARINCIISGCCLGAYIPGMNGVRFPTREIEIVFYIGLLIYFWRKENTPKPDGINYPIYMITYGVFRFIIQWFRHSEGAIPLQMGHLWAILSFIVGFAIYAEIKKIKTKKKHS